MRKLYCDDMLGFKLSRQAVDYDITVNSHATGNFVDENGTACFL